MPQRIFAIVLLAFAASSLGSFAHAASDPAELLIRKGVELRKKGKNQEALERFQEAYDFSHTPRAAAQLGLCEQSLERWIDSDAHLTEALTSSDPWIERSRATLERSLEDVRSKLASIVVTGNPAGAIVRVNDQPVGKLPSTLPARILPGKARIAVSAAGYRAKQLERTVNAGETATVEVTLESESGSSAPSAPSTPAVASEDPSVTSASAAPAAESREGAHGALRTASYVAWGVGALALGFGVYSHIGRESAASDFASAANGCDKQGGQVVGGSRCEGFASDFDSNQTRMVIGYVGAGVLAATGLTLWLVSRPSSAPEQTASANLTCAPTLLGGTCYATF